jgi:hypothetical protein
MNIQWLGSNAHLLLFFLEGGHQEEVMDIQWLPSTIKFDQESAFPKELKNIY